MALQFVDYYNAILQFQTTAAYLKDPPPSYQQPATDLYGGLADIRSNVQSGGYANEYEFEVALQQLLQTAHDGHLYLQGGALNVFGFTAPFPIVSISEDGIALPKVYSLSMLPLLCLEFMLIFCSRSPRRGQGFIHCLCHIQHQWNRRYEMAPGTRCQPLYRRS